jgi:hypothetical protein
MAAESVMGHQSVIGNVDLTIAESRMMFCRPWCHKPGQPCSQCTVAPLNTFLDGALFTFDELIDCWIQVS